MLDKQTKDGLMCLVRLGIGHTNNSSPEVFDWPAIYTLASDHGLLAIVLDGIQKLVDNGLLVGREIDVALKKKWIGTVIQNYEWKFEDYRKQIGQLARFFNLRGFRLMIIKGYGLALNYPFPQHRPCGDIDIWSFGKYQEVDKAISKELSVPINSNHHHHTVFTFNGYLVENHYDFVNVHYGHKNASLEKVFKELAMDDSVRIDVNGETVILPSANLNALFLLRHCMLHFASTKMNLRQMLDWGFFIKKHTLEIDWSWLMRILDEYHMMDFFRCMNAICTEDLGFDTNIFPAHYFNSASKNRVLNDILSPEFDEKMPTNVLRRIYCKYRRWQANSWKQDLCYGDSRFMAFMTGVWEHIIKPGMI